MNKPESVLVWMANRGSYVENKPGTILRIKNASKFSQNNMGFNDIPGELVELKWEAVFKLRPTLIEVSFGRNPCSSLVQVMEENYENGQVQQFFENVKVLSLHMTDISSNDLLKLLKNFNLLAAFSFSDTKFSKNEWSSILDRLSQLNLRGINISDNILDLMAEKLDVSLLKLSGNPGIDVKEFQKGLELVTVKALVVEELLFTGETDAEQFLEVLPQSFPRLQTLVWDWNAVDPELTFDERSKKILDQLQNVYKSLNLEAMAIFSYTPSGETKSAIQEMARVLTNNQLPNVSLHQFASKGISENMPNFSLIFAGRNERIQKELIDMYVGDRTTVPPLGNLLRLCEENIVPMYPAIVLDFGGFDKSNIRQLYSNQN